MTKSKTRRKPQNKGMFWHVHHNVLYEYCYDARERRRYIRIAKMKQERPLRLRLMKPIRGYSSARFAMLSSARIRMLHAKQCSKCPWDGETIFPEV